MRRLFGHLFILAVAFILTPVLCGAEPVVFKHKTEKKIKSDDCVKMMGIHDKFPTYKCFDKNGELKPFDSKPDWEEADISEICFEKNDANKIVLKVVGKETKTEIWFYPDENGKLILFDPGKDWKTLNEADCRELRKTAKRIEVPKGISEIFEKEQPDAKP